ncbi:GNAT family N-acetyltransferase [Bogoriella caseilytica]|uniref:N-acetylglutamate synthase-like GNAT family acetyltransferase n=1 Tax=Bogoriella caseilytica TaxID=56055 RepID=A0A3N2BE83_9MICO|nr:GNAT family N-acetyltransferase [Bogoriella caseilytica]ROR73558.1 N-acetylglutamate synthase-like GNAT family acetyltransferase [Bogoriella caseilytica]
MSIPEVTLRTYTTEDEPSWLRCRALAFLGTQYYDDVRPSRQDLVEPAIALVAVRAGEVLGILDVEIEGELATIDTVAVHPDHHGRGIATALLARALGHLEAHQVTAIDAWTREDVASNRWYATQGFTAEQHYLHVHKEHDDDSAGFTSPAGLSAPVRAFAHANLDQEAELRRRYRRVYVCRRYVRRLA